MAENFLQQHKLGIAAVVVVLLIAFYIGGTYNSFAVSNQDVLAKWSEVENQYQRQADLIPNLVSVVASAAKVETKFVTDVTAARSQWQTAKPSDLLARDTAGIQMTNAITAFVQAVSTNENYPTLQANKQYTTLTDELSGTQNRITVARGRYIQSIQTYNTMVVVFPPSIIAKWFGFAAKDYYKAEPGALGTPEIGEGKLP